MLTCLAMAPEAFGLIEGLSAQIASMAPAALSLAARDARRPAARLPAVTVVEGAGAIAELAPDWRALAQAARGESVFQSYAFSAAAARYHKARGERVLVAHVERDGATECLLPVAIARRGGIRVATFLGDPIAQYGDALMDAHAPPQVAKLALDRLVDLGAVDVFQFRRVRADAALRPALLALGGRRANQIEAPFADLAGAASIETMLLGAGGAKQRRERARSRRRLEEQGAIGFEALRGAAALEILREAFDAKRGWLEERGLASAVLDDPEALAVIERLARAGRGDGEAVVAMRLTIGGEPAAYEVGLVHGARYHAYLGAVAPRFAGFSPGKVVMEEALGWCRAEGIAVYDLLPSDDPYKRQWSTGSVAVEDFVAPVTAAGRFYAGPWLSTIRPFLRQALDRAPAGLRRVVARAALQAGAR